MTFAPAKNGQYEPVTTTSAKDCVAAVTAMLIERATVGAVRTNHAAIRKASGAPSTRGLYLWEGAYAAKTFGVTLTPLLHLPRSTVRDTVAGGQAVGVTIDTSVTRYTTRRTNYYVGPHEVFAVEYQLWTKGLPCTCEKQTAAVHAEYRIEDPGTTSVGYLWWSAELVYKAAEKLTGGQGVNLLIAPDTEGRSWKAISAAAFRSEPSYSTGKGLGTLKVGTLYPGGRTQNGGNWRRADGTYANGWVHLKVGTTWGWSKGQAVV